MAHESAILTRIHERLESEMSRVRDEIRRYPAPIPACDAQFNYLLESREALSNALSHVRALIADGPGKGAGVSIEAFLDFSHGLDDAVKSEIRTIIEDQVRKVGGNR